MQHASPAPDRYAQDIRPWPSRSPTDLQPFCQSSNRPNGNKTTLDHHRQGSQATRVRQGFPPRPPEDAVPPSTDIAQQRDSPVAVAAPRWRLSFSGARQGSGPLRPRLDDAAAARRAPSLSKSSPKPRRFLQPRSSLTRNNRLSPEPWHSRCQLELQIGWFGFDGESWKWLRQKPAVAAISFVKRLVS